MKLVVAIVQDNDTHNLLASLTEAGHRATKLASTGGFLRSGNTTLLVGTADDQVDEVLAIIRRTCKAREQMMVTMGAPGATGDAFMPFPVEVSVGGATVFVMDIEKFIKC